MTILDIGLSILVGIFVGSVLFFLAFISYPKYKSNKESKE